MESHRGGPIEPEARVVLRAMRSEGFAQRLLAIGLVFVVLGAIGWAWIDPKGTGAGVLTVGIIAVIVALVLMHRGRSTI